MLDPAALAAAEALDLIVRGFLFCLRRDERGRLGVQAPHLAGYGAVLADWDSADLRRRVQAGRQQGIAKAVGISKLSDLQVLDGTGGLGRDAFTLAALGARVTVVERSPVVAALLLDALRRAQEQPGLQAAASRMAVCHAETLDALTQGRVDVVYLDPMYPDDGKRALPAKEMQILRDLTGGDADADALLVPALEAARRRVVVKRPLKAPPLAGCKPGLVFAGTQARFDVYLKPSAPPVQSG